KAVYSTAAIIMQKNKSVPPAFSRSNSQASMDSTSMEDFWCEVESIKESREDGSEEAMLLEFKPADVCCNFKLSGFS
uniref:Uncharacterized protein n=1 Tax=Geospiza parvula TaxID=87175 RepID=A0A8C3NE51_GEOPR